MLHDVRVRGWEFRGVLVAAPHHFTHGAHAACTSGSVCCHICCSVCKCGRTCDMRASRTVLCCMQKSSSTPPQQWARSRSPCGHWRLATQRLQTLCTPQPSTVLAQRHSPMHSLLAMEQQPTKTLATFTVRRMLQPLMAAARRACPAAGMGCSCVTVTAILSSR